MDNEKQSAIVSWAEADEPIDGFLLNAFSVELATGRDILRSALDNLEWKSRVNLLARSNERIERCASTLMPLSTDVRLIKRLWPLLADAFAVGGLWLLPLLLLCARKRWLTNFCCLIGIYK